MSAGTKLISKSTTNAYAKLEETDEKSTEVSVIKICFENCSNNSNSVPK